MHTKNTKHFGRSPDKFLLTSDIYSLQKWAQKQYLCSQQNSGWTMYCKWWGYKGGTHTKTEAERLLGLYPRDMLPEVHVSLFGIIPKREEGKWRLLFYLPQMVAAWTIAHKLRHKRCKVLAVISQPLSSTERSIHANLGHNLAYYKLRESLI